MGELEGGNEETRSSFGRESIFDRAETKAVSPNTFDQESIFFGLESSEDKPAPPSSDKFINSLINLLVEKTNIEKDFSDYVDNQVGEHNGGRAVIQLREEDYLDIFEEENYPDIFEENYPDIFDTAVTAGNFDGIVNGEAADSALVLAREEGPVRGKSFIEEEPANQLARLLSDIEADRLEEAQLKETVLATIRQRLRGDVDYRALARDRDFIDSVLYRFAIMKLPLRPEDIAVSEEAEVRRVE